MNIIIIVAILLILSYELVSRYYKKETTDKVEREACEKSIDKGIDRYSEGYDEGYKKGHDDGYVKGLKSKVTMIN